MGNPLARVANKETQMKYGNGAYAPKIFEDCSRIERLASMQTV